MWIVDKVRYSNIVVSNFVIKLYPDSQSTDLLLALSTLVDNSMGVNFIVVAKIWFFPNSFKITYLLIAK